MGIFHADADLPDKRQGDQCGNGVGDEGCEHEDHSRERDQHAVETEVLNLVGDGASDRAEEAR